MVLWLFFSVFLMVLTAPATPLPAWVPGAWLYVLPPLPPRFFLRAAKAARSLSAYSAAAFCSKRFFRCRL